MVDKTVGIVFDITSYIYILDNMLICFLVAFYVCNPRLLLDCVELAAEQPGLVAVIGLNTVAETEFMHLLPRYVPGISVTLRIDGISSQNASQFSWKVTYAESIGCLQNNLCGVHCLGYGKSKWHGGHQYRGIVETLRVEPFYREPLKHYTAQIKRLLVIATSYDNNAQIVLLENMTDDNGIVDKHFDLIVIRSLVAEDTCGVGCVRFCYL